MRMKAQCMNVGLHERPECVEDHAMTLEGPASLEIGRDYCDLEVTSTILGTGMTCVQVALVFHLQFGRPEDFVKPGLNQSDPVLAHGKTLRNGLTVTWR